MESFGAGADITVISGLAIGIDGAAHEGGLTVGVLATGLDVVSRAVTIACTRWCANRACSRARTAMEPSPLPVALLHPQPNHHGPGRRSRRTL
jgi:hypothetical protein